MTYFILFLTRAISNFTGFLAHLRPLPQINQFIIKTFISSYRVNTDEIEEPLSSFKSIGEFFVRKLKPSARPIFDTSSKFVCSPVDGVLRSSGVVDANIPVLVKKQLFNWKTFLLDPKLEEEFRGGTFFNFYLSPKDYHNIHFPLSGRVIETIHHPGGLLPVNDWSINRFPNLFCTNERLLAVVEGESFRFLVVMIGALNVGSIELAFDSEFKRSFFALKTFNKQFLNNHKYSTGDKFGSFKLGSSVVCVFPKGAISDLDLKDSTAVKYGSKLAALNY